MALALLQEEALDDDMTLAKAHLRKVGDTGHDETPYLYLVHWPSRHVAKTNTIQPHRGGLPLSPCAVSSHVVKTNIVQLHRGGLLLLPCAVTAFLPSFTECGKTAGTGAPGAGPAARGFGSVPEGPEYLLARWPLASAHVDTVRQRAAHQLGACSGECQANTMRANTRKQCQDAATHLHFSEPGTQQSTQLKGLLLCLQHWTEVIADGEALLPLSSRDGKLLKRVSAESRINAAGMQECLAALFAEKPWQAQLGRDLLVAAWVQVPHQSVATHHL